MKKLLGIVVLGLLYCNLVFGEITQEEKILQFLMEPVGEVRKEVHDLFWAGTKKKITLKELKNYKDNPAAQKSMDILITLTFYENRVMLQKNIWESLLVSYDTKSIYKTKKYKKSKEEYDLMNTSQFYSDREKKSISNKMFDDYIERLFVAAANNSKSFLDLDLEREDFSRDYLLKRYIQSLIFVNRIEKISDPFYFEK